MKNTISILALFILTSLSFAGEFRFKAAEVEELISTPAYEDEVVSIGHITTTRAQLLANIEGVEFAELEPQDPFLINDPYFKAGVNMALASTIVHTAFYAADDKKKHALAGALVGAGVTKICEKVFKKGESSLSCALSGAGAALLVGVLKEVYDSQGHGNVEAYDAIYTFVPGALISFKFQI